MKKLFLVSILFFTIIYPSTYSYGQKYALNLSNLYNKGISSKLCENVIIAGKPTIDNNYVDSSDDGIDLNNLSQGENGDDDAEPVVSKDGGKVIITTLIGGSRMMVIITEITLSECYQLIKLIKIVNKF